MTCAVDLLYWQKTGLDEISLACVSCVMVGKLFLELLYSSIQLVHQAIDCCIHVFFSGVGVNRITIYIHCCFRFMSEFLNSQDTVHVRYDFKMTLQSLNFRGDITSEGFSYFDVMALNIQLHNCLQFLSVCAYPA